MAAATRELLSSRKQFIEVSKWNSRLSLTWFWCHRRSPRNKSLPPNSRLVQVAFNLYVVLDTFVQSAARLCEAEMAWVVHPDGSFYRILYHKCWTCFGWRKRCTKPENNEPGELSGCVTATPEIVCKRTYP
jgi:hypothetical protein